MRPFVWVACLLIGVLAAYYVRVSFSGRPVLSPPSSDEANSSYLSGVVSAGEILGSRPEAVLERQKSGLSALPLKDTATGFIDLAPPQITPENISRPESIGAVIDLGPRTRPGDIPIASNTEVVDLGPRTRPGHVPIASNTEVIDLGPRTRPGDIPITSNTEVIDPGPRTRPGDIPITSNTEVIDLGPRTRPAEIF